MSHYRTRLPLYGKPILHLVLTDDIKAAHAEHGVEWTDDCTETGGECHGLWPNLWVFVENCCLTDGWLDHECFHAALDACQMLGIDVRENDDAGAYLFEWMRGWARKITKNACLPQKG